MLNLNIEVKICDVVVIRIQDLLGLEKRGIKLCIKVNFGNEKEGIEGVYFNLDKGIV